MKLQVGKWVLEWCRGKRVGLEYIGSISAWLGVSPATSLLRFVRVSPTGSWLSR